MERQIDGMTEYRRWNKGYTDMMDRMKDTVHMMEGRMYKMVIKL